MASVKAEFCGIVTNQSVIIQLFKMAVKLHGDAEQKAISSSFEIRRVALAKDIFGEAKRFLAFVNPSELIAGCESVGFFIAEPFEGEIDEKSKDFFDKQR